MHLLPALYGRIRVPEAVVRELDEGRRQGIDLPDVTALSWIDVSAAQPAPLPRTLGRGEQEALTLGLQTANTLVVLDDALARRYAGALGVAFIGTLGVLLKAKEARLISAVGPVLQRLDQLGFRLDAGTRASVLLLAGEADPPPD